MARSPYIHAHMKLASLDRDALVVLRLDAGLDLRLSLLDRRAVV